MTLQPMRVKLRDFEDHTYRSFHQMSDRHPIQARFMAFWPCSVSLVCATAEQMLDAIHPLAYDPPGIRRSLIGRVASILATEAVCIEFLILLPTVITPVRYVCALIDPKNIAPLWGFPYGCSCPSCRVPRHINDDLLPASVKFQTLI